MLIPTAIIGLSSSVITEVLKLIPQLNNTKKNRRLLSLVVALVLSVGYIIVADKTGADTIVGTIVLVLTTSLGTYKGLLKNLKKEE